MANIKKYNVEHMPTYADIDVEIDFDFVNKIKTNGADEDYPIMQGIKDMVEFWAGWENKLKDNHGSYIDTFLNQLCEKVIRIVAAKNLNVFGVIDEMKGEEGWCPLDGSFGIKLISIREPDFTSQSDYNIIEQK